MGGIFRQYSWAFNLVAVLLCSFFLAKIVGVSIGKRLEVRRSIGVLMTTEVVPEKRELKDFSDYRIVIERNIFDSTELEVIEEAAEGELVEGEAQVTGEASPTTLDITVLGVLVVGDGRDGRSTATVGTGKGRRGKGKAAVYAVGDEESFAPNTRLVMVAPDRIEFLNGGRLEFAEVGTGFGESIFGPPRREAAVAALSRGEEKAGGVRMETPGSFVIDQTEVDNALQNLDKLYTEIRAVPNFSGGKVSGMKILSVKRGSIFAKLGLKRGDVLQRINGLELDVKQGFAIFNQLKDAKNLTVDLIRHGQPQTLEYEIR